MASSTRVVLFYPAIGAIISIIAEDPNACTPRAKDCRWKERWIRVAELRL